ncbi:nickel-dependent lactate racemase [Paenibacillus ginsengihumi]|uniref:nickel-dependent lactate racemase n=1 Tax=Paenibacillus ginsengihumi TaxID=431596 RepID=UPI000365542E|nr:nickel-dependent lactate racemase [Paenibacillus ginsengihumi]
MTTYSLPYGKGSIPFRWPAGRKLAAIMYDSPECGLSRDRSLRLIREALNRPVGTPRLSQLASGHDRAVILISDGTRLCPSDLLLPPLLEELRAGGIAAEAVDIVIALGLHRKHTADEIRALVGDEVFGRVRVHNHSAEPEDCLALGTTTRGTPVEINRLVAECPLRIATGGIEPHALVGVSGGVKALIPGAASRRSIEHNHRLSVQHRASPGDPDNPVHQDLEEALRFVPIHFLLNVVVNHERHVLQAACGDVIAAHREGVRLAASRFTVPVHAQYDRVIVSPGGHPKDMQIYQALKALRNAAAFTRPGGAILLVARCEEHIGNGLLQYWLETMKDRQQMVAKLKERFEVGPHKMLHLAEVLARHPVHLHSALPRHWTELLGFKAEDDVQAVVDAWAADESLTVAYMPHGSLTFPRFPSTSKDARSQKNDKET